MIIIYLLHSYLFITIALASSNGFINSIYFASWDVYARNFKVSDLDVTNITHLNYAFANLSPDGTVLAGDVPADIGESSSDILGGNIQQLWQQKVKNRHLKTMLSIGGSKGSTNFSTVANSESSRKRFAQSAVDLMNDWGFDGIDIDWEYVIANDAAAFTALLQAVRAQLDLLSTRTPNNYHFQLSIAAPADPTKYQALNPYMKVINTLVDYMNLLTYDFAGSWSSVSGHTANLYPSTKNPNATPFNVRDTVMAYISGGISSSKLVLGVPLYGRSFEQTDGPGTPFRGVGNGSWESGVWDYKSLPRAGAQVIYDETAEAPYTYSPVGIYNREFISFDTVRSVRKKADFVKDKGLGGMTFWEVSGDRNGDESLIANSAAILNQLDQSLNCITYPASKYANIRDNISFTQSSTYTQHSTQDITSIGNLCSCYNGLSSQTSSSMLNTTLMESSVTQGMVLSTSGITNLPSKSYSKSATSCPKAI